MDENVKLMLGNNIDKLKELPNNFVDSIVTDPPYGLSFMGKKWDYDVPSVEFWQEVYRVLKPGGHILSFGGTRTYHRMVVNMEDAGFEIRDCIMWVYGSGFPKSHNIGKAVDKIEGNEREFVGYNPNHREGRIDNSPYHAKGITDTNPTNTKGQSEWEGWGTALKPANEPICVARKPLSEKTIVENVLRWGTGGINIDGCRIGNDKITSHNNIYEGRFPANFIIDEEASILLDEQSGNLKSGFGEIGSGNSINDGSKVGMKGKIISCYADTGGASRFFYIPKVSKKERNMGLDNFEDKETKITNQSKKCNICNKWELASSGEQYICKCENPDWNIPIQKNSHPTVKPINLLTYLVRMVTPPNGIVMDCYMGSGSVGISARLEGFQFIGMEMDEEYFNIAEARINNYELYKDLIKKK
jgi:site-specific DNA-methyltransferase (adenine-specific)